MRERESDGERHREREIQALSLFVAGLVLNSLVRELYSTTEAYIKGIACGNLLVEQQHSTQSLKLAFLGFAHTEHLFGKNTPATVVV